MIGITERAKAELKTILVNNVDNHQACLRLNVDEHGQFGLGIDVEMPGDAIIEYEGSTLLAVDKDLAESLSNIHLDVEDTDEGSQLVVVEKSS